MSNRPDYLISGEDARLIPVVSESNREHRLLSPVLAAIAIVPEFASDILTRLGLRIGKRTSARAMTEVVFKGSDFNMTGPTGC